MPPRRINLLPQVFTCKKGSSICEPGGGWGKTRGISLCSVRRHFVNFNISACAKKYAITIVMHANDFICPPPRISQLRRNFVIARREGVQKGGGGGTARGTLHDWIELLAHQASQQTKQSALCPLPLIPSPFRLRLDCGFRCFMNFCVCFSFKLLPHIA